MNSSLGNVLIPARLPRIARTALMLLLGLLFWLSLAGPLIATPAVSREASAGEVVV